MAFDIKVFYCKKSFSQKFVDYLGPNYRFSFTSQLGILELRALKNNFTRGYFH